MYIVKSKIGELVEESGLRRNFIAKHCGVTTKQVSNWCTGRSFPTFEKAFILAYLLKCKVDDLAEVIKKEPTQ
jgi:transcriptional regulator with XRE-family HTH domain